MSAVEDAPITLLDVILAVAEVTKDDGEVAAVVSHMIRSGIVRCSRGH